MAEEQILHGASRTSWPYRYSEVTPLQTSGPQSCEVTPVCGMGSPGLRSFVKGAPGHSHSHPDGGALRTRCSFPSGAGVSATPHSCIPPHICPLRDLLIYTLRRGHLYPRGAEGMRPQDGHPSVSLLTSQNNSVLIPRTPTRKPHPNCTHST